MAAFQNRVFAILGGASGMGLETVQILLARQARVAVFDISAENLRGLQTNFLQNKAPIALLQAEV